MPKVLIVEDEPSTASMLEEFLEGIGFETETVNDGLQAVERVRSEQPSLIIMDLMLPRLTGGEAARLIKQDPAMSRVPILAISGLTDAQDFADLLAVDVVVSKPFDLDDLRLSITSLLGGEIDGLAP